MTFGTATLATVLLRTIVNEATTPVVVTSSRYGCP